MKVSINEQPFNAYQVLQEHESILADRQAVGACANFIGSMRDNNAGRDVHSMTLEYYPGMTEQQLEQICLEAQKKWQLIDVLVSHRVGKIALTEHIVLVAVWSAHRKQAFEACRFIMEYLKDKAPFWKKEYMDNGDSHWVEENTPG